jgi:hypothetical protein
MYHQPLTKEEAVKHRYGQRAGYPNGYAYVPGRCVHKAGKGPDGLYCGIRAKKVEIEEAAP